MSGLERTVVTPVTCLSGGTTKNKSHWPSTFHRPSSSGKRALTSGNRSGSVNSTRSGFAARSSSGDTIGMSVPGIRLPCLAGEASATAASNRESMPGAAEEGDRPRRSAVREDGAAGCPPPLRASSAAIRRADQRCVGVRRRQPGSVMPSASSVARMRCTDSSGSALSVYGCEQHRSAVQVELPCGDNPHARPRSSSRMSVVSE